MTDFIRLSMPSHIKQVSLEPIHDNVRDEGPRHGNHTGI
jgi:hypothetical protein